MKVKIKKLSSLQVYKGKTLNFFVDQIKLNSINTVNEYVQYPEAAGVIPIIDKKIVMVSQCRITNKINSLEIPAGKKDKNESILDCAKRELIEETGYRAKKFIKLIDYFPCISYSTERLHIFVATNLEKTIQRPDEDEFLIIKKYSLEKILNLIKQNKIKDSKTILAILYFSQFYPF